MLVGRRIPISISRTTAILAVLPITVCQAQDAGGVAPINNSASQGIAIAGSVNSATITNIVYNTTKPNEYQQLIPILQEDYRELEVASDEQKKEKATYVTALDHTSSG